MANRVKIVEAASRTSDFARTWSQRCHQVARPGYLPESLPGLQEIDDITREANRMLSSLSRIREVVIAQHTALSEQRARAFHGDYCDADYAAMQDDFKGGFAMGDAKKTRRGVSRVC